jgi:caffeoyl-CoA O-methyltransferase
MTRRSEQISHHLNAYLTAHSTPPDAILRELATETAERFPSEVTLQVAPEMGTLLTLLTRLSRASSGIEVGTFTGSLKRSPYALSLSISLAMIVLEIRRSTS